ncbi:hypothetical protein GGS20DRAFT_537144 [Poronia punctata]|nr:hypothetical protein GGS20DRAFT_537144 [Poronia punctata]
MSIRRLPDDAIAQIKSSTTIQTLNGVVCGLVSNALDANATKIKVSVDYVRGSCSVEDDGLGIQPVEFGPDGSLGKLHYTSKYPPCEDVHGKYGTFLASLASLSLISITSHHHAYQSHNTVKIRNSDVLARHTPAPPDQRLLSFPHGTRVTVRDLFGSMPVRVKQRGIDAERGQNSKNWELLRRAIVALILAWDGSISMTIHESASHWSFSLRGGKLDLDHGLGENSLAARVSNLIYQASLSEEKDTDTWIPLKASAGTVSVTGVVSLRPVATRRIQFISLGVRPVSNEHGSNILYEEINRIFSNSSYGVEENEKTFTSAEGDEEAKSRYYERESFTGQELRGRKGVDRWPMFHLKIHAGKCSDYIALQDPDEVLDERHDSLKAILDMLKLVTYEFLKKYHFCPKRIKNVREKAPYSRQRPASPRKSLSRSDSLGAIPTRTLPRTQHVGDLSSTQLRVPPDHGLSSRPTSPFDLWARVKSGLPQTLQGNMKPDKQLDRVAGTPSPNVQEPVVDNTPSENCTPFRELGVSDSGRNKEKQPPSMSQAYLDEGIRWTNPNTKETITLDPRSGFVMQHKPNCQNEPGRRKALANRKTIESHAQAGSKDKEHAWLRDLMSSWDNPVFKPTESRIPGVYTEDNMLGGSMKPFGGIDVRGPPDTGISIQGRLSKVALRDAKVVAQVDRKFILVKVLTQLNTSDPLTSPSASSLLVMVDQHAADERCRVESLMSDYFEVQPKIAAETSSAPVCKTGPARTELLDRPINFDVSPRDAAQFEHTARHFAYWGIMYHLTPKSMARKEGRSELKVISLPPSIAERCRLEPRLLIELLRKEAWKIEEQNSCQYISSEREYPSLGNVEEAVPNWVTQLHGCPDGILDMINSRACRSSVMFNDALSHDQCTDLLKRLADCVFPFQCAHGRPSMIPLVDLGDSKASDMRINTDDTFAKRFKAWET